MKDELHEMFLKVKELTKDKPVCEVVGCDIFRSMSIPHSPYCYYHTIYDPAGKEGKEYGL